MRRVLQCTIKSNISDRHNGGIVYLNDYSYQINKNNNVQSGCVKFYSNVYDGDALILEGGGKRSAGRNEGGGYKELITTGGGFTLHYYMHVFK